MDESGQLDPTVDPRVEHVLSEVSRGSPPVTRSVRRISFRRTRRSPMRCDRILPASAAKAEAASSDGGRRLGDALRANCQPGDDSAAKAAWRSRFPSVSDATRSCAAWAAGRWVTSTWRRTRSSIGRWR